MPRELTPAQRHVAQQLFGIASQAGLPPHRALEFVAAGMAESSLNPMARNKSSGAAGIFQLLSPGYRNRAQQLGGLNDVRANALAILPDYQRYWQTHPNAIPGEGAAAVERSGEGAGFYAAPLSMLGGLGGAGTLQSAGASPTQAAPGQSAAPPGQPPQPGGIDPLAQELIQSSQQTARGQPLNFSALAGARPTPQAQPMPTPQATPTQRLFPDAQIPKDGKIDSRLVGLAHNYGLSITPQGGYRDPATNRRVKGSPTSLHMSGMAIDVNVTDNAHQLAMYAQQHPEQFVEFFGPMGWHIKNGKIKGGAFPNHGDHYHISLR